MSHTQGPWKVDKNHKGFVNIRRDVDSYTSDIATVWDFYAENYESNAHLIAAAPELLAVLEELRESASYWSEYDVPLGIVERIESAIRKARGEE